MEERSVLEVAKEYLAKGYSVIPLEEGGKRPAIPWERFQKERGVADDLQAWFADGRRNVGIVCGRISNVGVVDFDVRHGGGDHLARFKPMASVTTGGNGKHYYYCLDSIELRNFSGILPGLDVRAEGGYVVAPPSKTQMRYTWDTKEVPWPKDLPPIQTSGLMEILSEKKLLKEQNEYPSIRTSAGSFLPLHFLPATEGNRNHTAARMAGQIIRRGAAYNTGYDSLLLWNVTSVLPPLEESELRAVWDSIWHKEQRCK